MDISGSSPPASVTITLPCAAVVVIFKISKFFTFATAFSLIQRTAATRARLKESGKVMPFE